MFLIWPRSRALACLPALFSPPGLGAQVCRSAPHKQAPRVQPDFDFRSAIAGAHARSFYGVMTQILIAHAPKDKSHAALIARRLKRQGADVRQTTPHPIISPLRRRRMKTEIANASRVVVLWSRATQTAAFREIAAQAAGKLAVERLDAGLAPRAVRKAGLAPATLAAAPAAPRADAAKHAARARPAWGLSETLYALAGALLIAAYYYVTR